MVVFGYINIWLYFSQLIEFMEIVDIKLWLVQQQKKEDLNDRKTT